MHYRRINSVQKGIDNNLPSSYDYPIVKLKKEQQIEGKCFVLTKSAVERCVEIERDNRNLLERMTKILAGPQTKGQGFSY